MNMLSLNLPAFDYKIKQNADALSIYDIIRKKYILLTPEEWVRQHFVHYLIGVLHISKNLISIEQGLRIGRLQKRSDIIVWGHNGHPLLLVECKAPYIALDDPVLFQAGTYNQSIQAGFIGITNGMQHYFFQKESSWKMISPEKLEQLLGLRAEG